MRSKAYLKVKKHCFALVILKRGVDLGDVNQIKHHLGYLGDIWEEERSTYVLRLIMRFQLQNLSCSLRRRHTFLRPMV